jgi:hypothetical protein
MSGEGLMYKIRIRGEVPRLDPINDSKLQVSTH